MPKLNFSVVLHVMGILLVFNGVFMSFAAITSWYYDEQNVLSQLVTAFLVAVIIGILLMFFTKNHNRDIGKKEGYLIVTLGWVMMALSGCLPYLFTGTIPNFTNAFFETISGYTTTGATILDDIEIMPKGILIWRSLTHWIGGMGIIVLTIAVLPMFGIGGMQLFTAEAPGISADKLKPRITDTAKRLWLIYFSFTAIETLLLNLAGMSLFDAVNHALSTLSTGGFSTKNASIAYWNGNFWIEYIIIIFMFISGTNFVLFYFAFKLKFKKFIQNEEFRWYASIVLISSVVTFLAVYFLGDLTLSSTDHPMNLGTAEATFRHSLFQVVSVITTTGFVTSDFTAWLPFVSIFFFGLFFLGGSAGSTAGGVKIVRQVFLIKNGILEFKRMLHPNAILPMRYNGKSVDQKIVYTVLGFFVLYMLSFIVGTLVMSLLGLDFMSSVGAAASSLGNVGPAYGIVSPVDNFNTLPQLAKWWSAFLMLIGRLELFTVLILFTPYYWKSY
jgi:trk system potassium uptake protein TrkH